MNPEVLASPALSSASTLNLHVTDTMVARFAALTGDRSSLHVNAAFARRSAYRRPIVHGMLPLSFLPLLPPFRLKGLRAHLIAVSGRFTLPVYVDDPLVLSASPARLIKEGPEVEIDFRIEHQLSRAEVTSGTAAIRYEREAPPVAAPEDSSEAMLSVAAELRLLTLEEIQPGMGDSLEFRVSTGCVGSLIELLSEGARLKVDVGDIAARFDTPSFLAVLLLSTSVGVSLPGAYATFLEFAVRMHEPVEIGRDYLLQGSVAHRSRSTRIIKKDIAIVGSGGDGPIMSGRAGILVNKPASPMPSVDELKSSAGDLGLTGKTVLITGASRGIGETTAKLFALSGARVIVNYHRGAEDAARVVDEIHRAGGSAIAVAADVSDAAAVAALVQTGIAQYGGIDVLVNNAARDFRPVPFLRLSWDDVQKDIDVIVKGSFLCCQQVIPQMVARGGGKIINISSIATETPPPDQAKYVMAKSALVGLTRSLAAEFASKGIQANLVVPNFVETDFVAHIPEGFRAKIAQQTPMGRNALPVEVARAVLFLASSFSSFTSGQKIMVTGGSLPYL